MVRDADKQMFTAALFTGAKRQEGKARKETRACCPARASPRPARGMHAALRREAPAPSHWCGGLSTEHWRKGIQGTM